MRLWKIFCAAFGALAAASNAAADSNWLGISALGWQQEPGRLFFSPGIEGGVQKLSRWTAPTAVFTFIAIGSPLQSRSSFEPSLGGVEPGGTFGYTFRDGDLPPWLGNRVRVGLTGSFATFTQQRSFDYRISGSQTYNVFAADGQALTGFAAPAGADINEVVRVNRTGFDLNLRVASDFAVGRDLVFTPSVAVFGGRTRDHYEFSSNLVLLTGAQTFNLALDQRVYTRTLGAEFAGGLTWQITPTIAVNVTGRAGVVHLRSALSSTDCVTFNVGIGCAMFPNVFTVHAENRASTVGFRGGLSLGTALDMRLATLSLGGMFTYDSQIPSVVNRSDTASTGGPIPPAHIRFAGGFRYGAFATLRIRLLIGM